MLVFDKLKNRGDTLIEVLFAITIFSLVVVGAISIMNQGVNASQRAIEITLVRNEIDAQAETLRFLNSSYLSAYGTSYAAESPAGQWSTMSHAVTADSVSDSSQCSVPQSAFILNTKSAKYITGSDAKFSPADTFSQIEYETDGAIENTKGIWIEATKPSSVTQAAGYIDFYIRACWDAPGQSISATISTIVRLYEPK